MTAAPQRPLKPTHPGGGVSPAPRLARAFTLLELLVVIAILAILAALLLPALSRARIDALAVRSSQNLRTLTAANLAYAADTGSYAPADNRANNRRWCAGLTSGSKVFDPTRGYLAPYLGKSGAVVACPLFTQMLKGSKSFEDGTGGYGYNATYIGGTPSGSYNPDGNRHAATPAQVPRPATTLMFATTAYASGDSIQEYPYADPPFWTNAEGLTSVPLPPPSTSATTAKPSSAGATATSPTSPKPRARPAPIPTKATPLSTTSAGPAPTPKTAGGTPTANRETLLLDGPHRAVHNGLGTGQPGS